MNDDKIDLPKDSPNGVVETQYFKFDSLALESGEILQEVTIAYETYGKLNEKKDNAILLCHALSGDAHLAGISKDDNKLGWWEFMIGPRRAFDTNKYFIIGSNVLGGCKGSTGPSSVNPKTNKPYGSDFPEITIKDMVNAQVKLIEGLGIKKLFSVAGGSMGGMQVIEWTYSHPKKVATAIPIATTFHHSAQQIAFNEVGRISIMNDPDWSNGDYYGKKPPVNGLSIARMIGHITYMSDDSMKEKFGRRTRSAGKDGKKLNTGFEVESYLRYQGEAFVKRFDANTYICVTKAIDFFDAGDNKELIKHYYNTDIKFLVISYSHDWIYPPYQSKEIVKVLKFAQADVTYCDISKSYGHDAFLIPHEEQGLLIGNFLNNNYNKYISGVKQNMK
ncbi:MAG: homoserine O-acetyltransferase [Candidatus Firestonebacteria bacterium GWA2_43_8]|nr:MAG: homoserine O-acetyltransferase [Candidatus Firestonebacteria bacterium GWA2_43_8]